MSSIVNSSAEPSYISRLALTSSPFNADAGLGAFFHGEQIDQRLNLLSHLVRASDKVACVFAKPGVGKSSLLNQFQQSAGDDLRLCCIEGESSLTPASIITQCLHSFGVDESETRQSDNQPVLLQSRLKRLRGLNIKPVLLIDNVDKCSIETIAAVIACLLWADEEGFLLQAVLSASSVMSELESIHGRQQRVDLPKLTEHELPNYLMHRLTAVGYQGELPFTPKVLKQFYRHSLGNPDLLNKLAHQQLLGLTLKSPRSSMPFTMTQLLSLLKWISLGALVISLIVLLIFQDSVNSLFTQSDLNETPEEILLLKDETLATVVLEEDEIVSSEQAERVELTALVSELSLSPSENTLAETQEKEDMEPQLESDISLAIPKPEQEIVSRSIHPQAWILEQNSSHYTFQLMGSWQHSEVTEFINKYALSGDVAEFQSMRNGRIWYALIYGVYPDKQTALQQSKKWPAPLNTLPSWLRRFDSVKKQLKDRE